MKNTIIRTWAVTQIIIGLAIIGSTAHYAPPALDTMKNETKRTGTNLHEISEALDVVRMTYAETATNLFDSTREMADVETKLVDAGQKLGDVGHMFDQHGRQFAKSERHNRESKIFWGKMETPFAKYIANVYGDLKEWSLTASTNLLDVGRDLTQVAETVGILRETIVKYQLEGHTKTLEAMASSAETIGHVGDFLSDGETIDLVACSVYVLCGIVSLLFIGNGIVFFVVASGDMRAV